MGVFNNADPNESDATSTKHLVNVIKEYDWSIRECIRAEVNTYLKKPLKDRCYRSRRDPRNPREMLRIPANDRGFHDRLREAMMWILYDLPTKSTKSGEFQKIYTDYGINQLISLVERCATSDFVYKRAPIWYAGPWDKRFTLKHFEDYA